MEIPETLDITAIEPRLKNPVILEKFDALSPGKALVISNDHDFRRLYNHLLAGRGPTFQWTPLENGPEIWKIKIVKKEITANLETIRAIVSKDYRKARVLKNLGIDFSCGGSKTLQQACNELVISSEDVLLQLSAVDSAPSEKEMDYLNWDIAFLAKYIIEIHHRIVVTQTKFLTELANKVAISNQARHPEIRQVVDLFTDACKMLELNCHEEEKVLFPHIVSLGTAHKNGTKTPECEFGPISALINLAQAESKKVADGFRRIRLLTNGYVAPVYASNFCPTLYKLLAEYENDMHLHLHLENNILFPKALEVEGTMRSKQLIC